MTAAQHPVTVTSFRTSQAPPDSRPPVDPGQGPWILADRSRAVAEAARIATAVLRHWRTDRATAEAVLAAARELVTRAVRRTAAPVGLHLDGRAGGARIHVCVTGAPGPADSAGWISARTCGGDPADPLIEARGTRTYPDHGTTHWIRIRSTPVPAGAGLPAVPAHRSSGVLTS